MVESSQGYSDFRKSIRDALIPFRQLGMEITQDQIEIIINSKVDQYVEVISNEIGKSKKLVKPILERNKTWNRANEDNFSTKSVAYKAEEYSALTGEVPADDSDGDFVRESTDIKEYDIPFVKGISLIHKVREVQALVGFSRLEPVEKDGDEKMHKIKMVDVKEKDTRWYPGYEVRGEGIFIEFDDDAIGLWRTENSELSRRVQLLNENYSKSYYGSRRTRNITSKMLLLHTLSHVLMKQLSFECGYNIASLKERIYCSEPSEGRSMSGIFIYTASGDSEGTMGGLVRQGRPDVFSKVFKKAIDNSLTCSNDPVCSLSQGQGRDSLNLSACYSCTLVPETSCEEFNVFLDRGMVVGTFEHPELGFYSDFVNNWNREYKNHEGKRSNPKEEKKENNTTSEIIIKDYGVLESTHLSVWENLLQFVNLSEKEKVSDLISNIEKFDGLEIPGCDGTFSLISSMEDYGVDLIWRKSKVMVFSSDNKEEYNIASKSDWKCFNLEDEKFGWQKLLEELKED